MISRRGVLGALAGVLVLPALAACPASAQPEEVEQTEEPDCDEEDMLTGDTDCYPGVKSRPRATRKAKPRATGGAKKRR
jgi:hypothetical protein